MNKYKEKVLKKLEKQIELYKESSGSWIFFNRIFQVALDWLLWIGIAILIYGWWTTRGAPIGCERITPDLCNSCFAYGKEIITGVLP